jgi:hypothetical protein
MRRTSCGGYPRIAAVAVVVVVVVLLLGTPPLAVNSFAWTTTPLLSSSAVVVVVEPRNGCSIRFSRNARHGDHPTQSDKCAESTRRRWNLPCFRITPPTTLFSEQSSSSSSSSSSAPAASSSTSGYLVAAQSDLVKTQLLSAFTNLGVSDQYDAVLTGLCAKILDAPKGTTTTTAAIVVEEANEDTTTATTTSVSLSDCTDLLQEMNSQSIPASPRSLMALIDVRDVVVVVVVVHTHTHTQNAVASLVQLCGARVRSCVSFQWKMIRTVPAAQDTIEPDAMNISRLL